MILGLSVEAFTKLHVGISLVAILSGIVVAALMVAGRQASRVTLLYVVTNILTDLTGFLFHSTSFGPPHILGLISLVVMALACWAYYIGRLVGAWRGVWVVTALAGLWLNVFVLIVQAFQKLPALHPLAPTGSEPPFAVAQGVAALVFIGVGWLAWRRFRPVVS